MENDFQRRVHKVAPIMEKHLDRLKIDFKTEIDSNRRLERICTFEELIALLVKRDFITDDKTTWTKLNPILRKYENVEFSENQDSCLNNILRNDCSDPLRNPFSAQQPLGLPVEVISYLSSRISFSWRLLAKSMGLTQLHIDDIEQKCGKNYSQCVIEVLQTYEKYQAWMSKTGSPYKDIYNALKILNSGDEVEYLVHEFVRLTGFKSK